MLNRSEKGGLIVLIPKLEFKTYSQRNINDGQLTARCQGALKSAFRLIEVFRHVVEILHRRCKETRQRNITTLYSENCAMYRTDVCMSFTCRHPYTGVRSFRESSEAAVLLFSSYKIESKKHAQAAFKCTVSNRSEKCVWFSIEREVFKASNRSIAG